jgi:hypothetical protein
MSSWGPDELARIGRVNELQVASHRHDGSLRPFVTIWAVRSGDELYVRSAHGPNNGWYRRARASGEGRIRAAGVERAVTFEEAPTAVASAVTAAYHFKYDRYGAAIVGTVVSPEAEQMTLRLVPTDPARRGRDRDR